MVFFIILCIYLTELESKLKSVPEVQVRREENLQNFQILVDHYSDSNLCLPKVKQVFLIQSYLQSSLLNPNRFRTVQLLNNLHSLLDRAIKLSNSRQGNSLVWEDLVSQEIQERTVIPFSKENIMDSKQIIIIPIICQFNHNNQQMYLDSKIIPMVGTQIHSSDSSRIDKNCKMNLAIL